MCSTSVSTFVSLVTETNWCSISAGWALESSPSMREGLFVYALASSPSRPASASGRTSSWIRNGWWIERAASASTTGRDAPSSRKDCCDMCCSTPYGFEICLPRNTRRRNEKLISPGDRIADRVVRVAVALRRAMPFSEQPGPCPCRDCPQRGLSLKALRTPGVLRLVAVDLDQTVVADSEKENDLVQHHSLHLPAKDVLVSSVEALQRAAVDRDLVRERPRVEAAASRQRDALVEAEQRLASGRLVLDDDLHVRHLSPQIRGQRVETLARVSLEPLVRLEQALVGLAHLPRLVRRRMPSRRCTARSASPSFRAPQTKTTKTAATGTAKNRITTMISAASFTPARVVSARYSPPSSGGSRRGMGEALIREVVVSP